MQREEKSPVDATAPYLMLQGLKTATKQTDDALSEENGFVDILGYKLYYRMFGTARKGNVVCLHGGPGLPHQYMLPFVDVAKDGYRVVLYDQLGAGRSEMPKDPALFTMERYTEDLEGIRSNLKLGKIHLVGNSCGGQLAIAYALKYQKNLKSLTLVGALANVPFVRREVERLKSKLPSDVLETLEKHEARGEYEDPEYLAAAEVFYWKHVCRLKEWPKDLKYAFEHLSKPVYYAMNGPNEFTLTGNIRYWNVIERLPSIRVPTLVTCGRYDEVSPKEADSIHRHIRGSKLVVFPRSSHLPFWEERNSFMKVQLEFLANVDGR